MIAWIKKRFEPSPNMRIGIAYWLGTAQMFVIMALVQDWQGKEAYLAIVEKHWTTMHWGWWAIAWMAIALLYIRNNINFKKETLWMTIKNPAKVTREEDELGWPPPPPRSRPPIPPAPPAHTNGSSKQQPPQVAKQSHAPRTK